MTDHNYVSTDHEAYVFSEAADKIYEGWSLVWWPSQDETLRSERRCQGAEEGQRIRQTSILSAIVIRVI